MNRAWFQLVYTRFIFNFKSFEINNLLFFILLLFNEMKT